MAGMLPDSDQIARSEYPPDYPFAPSKPWKPAAAKVPAPGEPAFPDLVGESDHSLPWPLMAGGLVVACGLVNLLMAPIVEVFDAPAPLVGLVYAVLLTQLAGHSLWTVWSKRPLWQRVLIGTLVLEALWACFVLGIAMSEPGPPDGEAIRLTACSMPLVTLCVAAPLWALRIYAQWQIVPSGGLPLDQPLSIRGILGATLVVAVAVSLVRLASDDPEYYDVAWIGWTIAAPSIAGASLLSLPPALYMVLRGERPVAGLFLLWGYATAAIVLLVFGIALFGGRLRGEELFAIAFSIYGFASLVWLLLLAVRSCGYRLAIGPSYERAP